MNAEQRIAAGNLALTRGMYHEALRHFNEAMETARSFAKNDPIWAELHRGLAQVYLQTDKPEEAVKAAQTALETDQAYWGAEAGQNAIDWFILGDALRGITDFERALSAYDKAKRLLEAEFGSTHEQTVEVYSRIIVLYLESDREYGFLELHKEALAIYQTCFPTGSWTQFIRLPELVEDYVAKGNAQKAEQMLKREIEILTKLLGRNHKEVAAVLKVQASLLKDQRRLLASWRVSTQTAKSSREGSEHLFLSEAREYSVPLDDCKSVIERMLSSSGAVSAHAPTVLQDMWWQTDRHGVANEVSARLTYNDGDGNARLWLLARFAKRGAKTRVEFDCTLANSPRIALAKDVVRYTISEIDQTLAIVPSNVSVHSDQVRAVNIPLDGFWPTPQQFNEAVQNPRHCFGPLELRDGLPEVNQLGLPRPCSGAFATVYRVGSSNGDWAVKCFTQRVTDQQARYRAISTRIDQSNLSYFVPFQYITEGVRIKNEWFPIVQMSWVQATALNVYIAEHLNSPGMLNALANEIAEMVDELQGAGIAHGDLQHGNIMLRDDNVILVDYDGMWVPELAKLPSLEIGHRNYQHPGRTKEHFGNNLDNFAGWLIYCSINCVARDPSLWERLDGGDDCLLLRYDDLINPQGSARLRVLVNHADEEVRNMAGVIERLLRVPFEKVPTFSTVFSGSS